MNAAFFETAATALPSLCFEQPPACGLILGSGWSQVLIPDTPLLRLSYADIPGLGASTVVGHAGELLLFERHGIRIAAFLGRRHWYEGAGWGPVVLPVELLRRMGTRNLLITNASGGISPNLKPGDLMVIRDHVNTVGINPLIGPVIPGWGERFPDQSQIYSPALIDLLRKAAYDTEVPLSDGVYAFTSGPGYETPAEIRAYAGMGADAVGMSTVPEATVANAAGLRTAGLSCITNMAAGISGPHLSHEEVLGQTRKTAPVMAALLDAFLARLATSL
ncbi:MAG TPA: purine-nucleoside phosphorylase [Kiritimatiellia bacterium]|nr:purine-nucleoside phosphorylase [Kiritimatiellia bacterium]HPS07420.1 purine-nucleoside phosphorylase [Kiritimatiellia bacterium]